MQYITKYNNILNIFDNCYDVFKLIINGIKIKDLFSLIFVCKKFNSKFISIIYKVFDKELYGDDKQILKTPIVYDANADVFSKFRENEIKFINKLIFKYYDDFIEIAKMAKLDKHEELVIYDEIYDLFYDEYIKIIFPNIKYEFIEHIEGWDCVDLDVRDFSFMISDIIDSKIEYFREYF